MVEDDLIIPQDSTLTLEPGVEVIFDIGEEENRDPFVFIVLGTLNAVGTESDSIYFTSHGRSFQGFNNDNQSEIGGEINFEYCVGDYAVLPFNCWANDYIFNLSHSTVYFEFSILNNFCSEFTIEFCEILGINDGDYGDASAVQAGHGIFSIRTSGNEPIIFNNVYAPAAKVGLHGSIDQLYNCNLLLCSLYGVNYTEIYDCTINLLRVNPYAQADYYIHDVVTDMNNFYYGQALSISDVNLTLENCTFYGFLYFSGSNVIARNNKVINTTSLYVIDENDSNLLFENNIILAENTAFKINLNENEAFSLINNTIITDNRAVELWDYEGFSEIRNNIFLGDGYESSGIYCIYPNSGNNPPVVEYNCFGLLSDPMHNVEFGTGNIISNPNLRDVANGNYQLQASSPCIDSADPSYPDDPDGSPPDMGCYFYDQRLDNPPSITSPTYVDEHAGSYFSYTATATDDYGPINFTFENLPEGIELITEELDWVADSARVAGNIPFDIPGFTFTIIATDVIGQADTQYVYVNLEAMNLLHGEISGVLSFEDSPYVVIDNITVPEGDTLIIEPGVTVLFRPEYENDRKLKIESYGTFIAEGTQEDSITFCPTGYINNYQNSVWDEIHIASNILSDTSIFKYCNIFGAMYGIQVDSSIVSITNSKFYNNYKSVETKNHSSMIIDSCHFSKSDYYDSYIFLGANTNSTIKITNSDFIQTPEFNDFSCNPFTFHYTSNGYVRNCYFKGGRNIGASPVEFSNNIVEDLHYRIMYQAVDSMAFFNNSISNSTGLILINIGSSIIVNNIFKNLSEGLSLDNDIPTCQVFNNIFFDNAISISVDEPESVDLSQISYNCFFENDSLSEYINLENTNLVLDPIFSDSLLHLAAGSPCIDGGHPDETYNDIDGTRNDIGLYGGPYGQSYEYPETISALFIDDEGNEIPSELKITFPYPNPFNNVTRFSIELMNKSILEIGVYNILGKQIESIYSGVLWAGRKDFPYLMQISIHQVYTS